MSFGRNAGEWSVLAEAGKLGEYQRMEFFSTSGKLRSLHGTENETRVNT